MWFCKIGKTLQGSAKLHQDHAVIHSGHFMVSLPLQVHALIKSMSTHIAVNLSCLIMLHPFTPQCIAPAVSLVLCYCAPQKSSADDV